ncbi:hypothetical protein ACFKHW_32030 [Bradyrhizobium lupini]|uniref:hypothetical protein n=1 Tax=Rhizobium lupini TaxID=136996 RepID=UPI00366C4AFD
MKYFLIWEAASMAVRQIALSLGRAILDRLSPDKDVKLAQLGQIALSLGRAILDRLSPVDAKKLTAAQEQAVQTALHIVKEGWPGYEANFNYLPYEKLHARMKGFIAELESNDPKRQRTVLASPELQAWLANERARNDILNSMHYFRHLQAETSLTARVAVTAIRKDKENHPEYAFFIDGYQPGQKPPTEKFLPLQDDPLRWETALFGSVALRWLGMVMSDVASISSDADLRERILGEYTWILAKLSSERLTQRLKDMEAMARETEPDRFAHYFDVFRGEGWKERFIEAQQEAQAKKMAAELERERVAKAEVERVAAEKQERIERQVTFKVEDGQLDISVRCWPEIGSDIRVLFDSMKAAFKAARILQCADLFRGRGEYYLVKRPISTMQPRQLACLKIRFWDDRAGLFHSVKPEEVTRSIVEILNCDGHADIFVKGSFGIIGSAFAVESENLRTDIEAEWLSNVEYLQQEVEKEGIQGELARWFIEDHQAESGWATSR